MARLPDPFADARPIPRPGVNVSGYEGGGQVAQAAGQMGAVIGRIGEDWQKERDTEAVFEARRKLDEWERTAIFDPEKGAANRLGKDAFGIGGVLAKDFDAQRGKIAEGLTTERQRKAFAEVSLSRRAQVLDWGARHEAKQRETYEAGQYEADVQSMADRAALFPDKAGGELAMMAQRTIGFMRAKGRSEEEIQAKVKADASRTHLGVVSAMVNSGRADEAKAYFDTNKAGMTAEASLRAEAALKEVVARQRAQTVADEVMGKGLGLNEALADVRGRLQGDEEAAAVQEVKVRFAEREAGRAQAQKQATDDAWKVITNGGGRKDIKPELWNSLHGEEQRQINDYLEAKWRRAKADAEAASRRAEGAGDGQQAQAYYGLRMMAVNEPAAFAGLDLMRYAPHVSKGDLRRLMELQASGSKADAKASELNGMVSRALKYTTSELSAAGINLKPGAKGKEAEEAAKFMNALTMALDDEAAQGRVSDKRAREIALGLIREGVEQGSGVFGFFQTRKRGYQMEEGKSYVSKTYSDIPAAARDALVNELAQRKKLARSIYGSRGYILEGDDKAAIERAYQRGIEQGRFR